MDKRTLYALVAMLALFLIFDTFVWKPQRRQKALATQETTQNTNPAPVDTLGATLTDSLTATGPAVMLDSLSAPDAMEELVKLKNDKVVVTFSTRGAEITQVELADFKMNGSDQVKLVNTGSSIAGVSLVTPDKKQSLSNVIFRHKLTDSDRTLVFYLGEEANPSFEKTYSLDDKYGIKLAVKAHSIANVKGMELDFAGGIADSEEYLRSKAQDYKFLLYTNQLQKFTVGSLKKKPPTSYVTGFTWAAVRSKYFTIAVREEEPALMNHIEAFISTTNQSPAFKLSSDQKITRNDWTQSFLIYAGPADYDILKSYGSSLENVAERGASWLRWLASIFAWFLKFLHSLIPNYGVVIIIFSIVLKIVLHPFTHKQMDASLKMQRIQPQVQAIQTQYKNDPRMMQQELSKLYKENGASPFSGCLPILIQMPIFISLYNVLRYSLDMRNAGFVFWLKDLSEPDKYMVLPILMGLFMIVQSRMMRPPVQEGAVLDEKQQAAMQSQKMMTWIMPVMMFFIFRGMPAGLVLYWTVFNILGILQQYYLQKHLKTKEITK